LSYRIVRGEGGRERERIIPNKILASDHPLLTHTRIIEHLLKCIMLSNYDCENIQKEKVLSKRWESQMPACA